MALKFLATKSLVVTGKRVRIDPIEGKQCLAEVPVSGTNRTANDHHRYRSTRQFNQQKESRIRMIVDE